MEMCKNGLAYFEDTFDMFVLVTVALLAHPCQTLVWVFMLGFHLVGSV